MACGIEDTEVFVNLTDNEFQKFNFYTAYKPDDMLKRILVIDNDKDLLEILKEALAYDYFEVTAVDAVDNTVFELINEHRPDVVLLDYLLWGVNGDEICHQIKSNPQTANLPVIMFSAYPRVLLSLGN